jgi:hypothetical protein
MVGGYGSNLDTPRHPVREGRLFNVVLPGVSKDRVSEDQVWAGRWVQPGGLP